MESNKKVFVGTVGYHILGNHSIGPMLLPQLQEMDFPDWVKVDELNWGPVAVIQSFEAEERMYDRVVILTAIERAERKIGDVSIFQWQGRLPDESQIQACVGDAATGVISVENLLVIGEYFKVWGEEVFLVDVEPGEEIAGMQFTPNVEQAIPEVLELVFRLATAGLSKTDKVSYLFGDTIFAE